MSRVALVTGASGGIGAAIAKKLGLAGYELALHYSSGRREAQAVADELTALNVKARIFRADLLKPNAGAALVKKVVASFGRLDVLVNNAGAVLGQDDFTSLSERDFERTMRLNAVAPFALAREAFKAMDARGGRIVNVSSVAAKFGGSARSLHYAAAKSALETMTVGLAKFGAPKNILVNAIRAGVIDTPFHGKFRKDMSKRVALIPLKRMGKAEDVAEMALFLCGRGGDFVTGQVLGVTGGE